MINEFFEKVFEVTSSVFNFAVDFFRSPIKTIYPCLKALSDKWYEFQRWFVGLFPTDEQGRSYSTNFVLFFVTISLFSCLFRPWRWDMVAKKIPPSAGGTIARSWKLSPDGFALTWDSQETLLRKYFYGARLILRIQP